MQKRVELHPYGLRQVCIRHSALTREPSIEPEYADMREHREHLGVALPEDQWAGVEFLAKGVRTIHLGDRSPAKGGGSIAYAAVLLPLPPSAG